MLWDRRAVVYGSTNVSCDAEHQFLNNTLGQNPCLIYAYMVGSCASVYVEVQALNQSSTYPAPAGDSSLGIQSASQCTCGRVPYNLISACSTCQGKSVLPWSSYDTYCENYDGKYNFSSHVPDGTALPVWATRQTNATSFAWNIALGDKGAGEFSATNSSGVASSLTGTATSRPTDEPYSPGGEPAATVDTAAVGLAATGLVLGLVLIAAFVYFWRRMKAATLSTFQNDKGSKDTIPASTIAHSALFSCVATLAIINASLTTWTSVALVASHELGLDALRSLLNFLVFTSWWTLLGSSFFLIAFLYDRSNRAEDGTFTATRFGSLHSHLIWLLVTCALWLLGASLFAASVAQREECPVHCTQLRAIPVFGFLELTATSLALAVVVYSYWTLRKRSKPPKRLGRQPSQTRKARR